MKKILICLLFLIAGCNCEREKEIVNDNNVKTYFIKYIVFYPGYRDTCRAESIGKDFYFGSDRGTNFIKIGTLTGNTIYIGSSPYLVIEHSTY